MKKYFIIIAILIFSFCFVKITRAEITFNEGFVGMATDCTDAQNGCHIAANSIQASCLNNEVGTVTCDQSFYGGIPDNCQEGMSAICACDVTCPTYTSPEQCDLGGTKYNIGASVYCGSGACIGIQTCLDFGTWTACDYSAVTPIITGLGAQDSTTGAYRPAGVFYPGDILNIYGSNFNNSGNTVKINSNTVSASYQSPSQINVPLSPSLSGTFTVTVTADCGTTNVTAASTGTITQPSCGSANGASSYTAPVSNLCSVGTASAVSNTGSWVWTCAAGQAQASCTAPIKKDGVCGPAATTYPSSQTSYIGSLCSIGTSSPLSPSFPAPGNSSTWNCLGVSGGNSSPVCVASRTATVVNGVCGSANNSNFYSAPVSNLCLAGTTGSVTGSGPWTWPCSGVNGGTTASCSANLSVNGVCGLANGVATYTAPSSNLCSSGTTSAVSGTGPWIWVCSGINGGSSCSASAPLKQDGACGTNATTYSSSQTSYSGSFCAVGTSSPTTPAFPAAGSSVSWTCSGVNTGNTVSCTATRTATVVNGVCGLSNNSNFYSAPVSNLCSAGTAGTVSGTGPWTWPCNGVNGGTTASCSANKSVNGVCGLANNSNFYSAPVSNLCSAGTTGSVTGTGPWAWPCSGVNGGTTASCSANLSVNGVCGLANGVASYTAPSSNLCSAGTASTVSNTGSWAWSCSGVNSGTTASCTAPIKQDGVCGPAATTYSSSQTSYIGSLCNIGTSSPLSPSFPAPGTSSTWNCTGVSGGNSSPVCVASRTTSPLSATFTATGWSYTNSVGPLVLPVGFAFTLNWTSSNANSCTIDGGAYALNGSTNPTTGGGGWNHTYTLICSGPGGTVTKTINVTTPPNPSNPVGNCPAPGTAAALSWTAPSGYSHFYVRAHDSTSGAEVNYNEDFVGTTYNIPNNYSGTYYAIPATIVNHQYSWWVHTRDATNGSYSDAVGTNFVCQPLVCPAGSVTMSPATITVGQNSTASAPAGWSGGAYNSSNSGIASVSGNIVTGASVGIAQISGFNWSAPNGATGCNLSNTNLTVNPGAKPHIVLSPTTLNFYATTGEAAPAGKSINISNTGTAVLNWAGSTNQSWCHVTSSGSINAGSNANITVTVDAPSNVGRDFPCTVTISDANADNNPQLASIYYTVYYACPNMNPVCSSVGTNGTLSWTSALASTQYSLRFDYPTIGTAKADAYDDARFPGKCSPMYYCEDGIPAASYCSAATCSVSGIPVTYGRSYTFWMHPGFPDPGIDPARTCQGTTSCTISAAKPHIVLSPTTFAFSGTSGGATPAGKTLTITNSVAGSTLNWTATTNQSWCHISSASGSTTAGGSPSTVTVTVDAPSNVGTFNCTVTITDANADNSPQTAAVTYVVSPAPPPVCNANIVGTNKMVGCAYSGMNFNTLNTSLTDGPTLSSPAPDSAIPLPFVDWGSGGPGTLVDNYSIRYKGTFNFTAGSYIFTNTTDDGGRAYFDDNSDGNPDGGVYLVTDWSDHGNRIATSASPIAVTAGNHTLIYEMYENGGGADYGLSWAKLSAPPPPTNINGSNSGTCQTVVVSWTDNSTTEDGFKVYRSTTNDPNTPAPTLVKDQITTSKATTGTAYSYTDTNLLPNTIYYYWITSYVGALESSRALGATGAFNANSCQANLTTSDKDIISVNNISNSHSDCSGGNEFPAATSYKVGDTIEFSINLCNSGPLHPATVVKIFDTMTNLERFDKTKDITNPAAWNMTVTGLSNPVITQVSGTEPADLKLQIALSGSIASGGGAKVKFKAKIALPTGFTGSSSRFQNTFSLSYVNDNINTAATAPAKATPLLLFVKSGTPTKIEVPP